MFNNPMYYNNPYAFNSLGPRTGLLGNLATKKINWSALLNNTQKTLNVINQAIPVYYQVKPIYNNAKTMFRMVNALKDDNKNNNRNASVEENKKNTSSSGPVFFT